METLVSRSVFTRELFPSKLKKKKKFIRKSTRLFAFSAGYESDVVLIARKVHRNNDTYLQFDPMKLDIAIGNADLYLSNLFGGDPILGK